MEIHNIPAGNDIPNHINVIIEIPFGSNVKYEIDKNLGALLVDRLIPMPVVYPANYGFINNTLADDGDPTDVLVITPQSLVAGSVISCRPIGLLNMEDESGVDEKVIAVPHSKITSLYDKIATLKDLPDLTKQQIEKFFEVYKDLEEGKWVKILGWNDDDVAKQVIVRHVQQYTRSKKLKSASNKTQEV